MPLIALTNAQLAFGMRPPLDGANLLLDKGQRLGLIGRDGAGKSSLLSVLAGQQVLDNDPKGAAAEQARCEEIDGLLLEELERWEALVSKTQAEKTAF